MSSLIDEADFSPGEILCPFVDAMYKYLIDHLNFCCDLLAKDDMADLFPYMSISSV
jgi:hypothetical protein